jgi:hypothetical protein
MHFPLLKLTGFDAITIWKWVLYADKNPSPILVNHERIHLDQIRKDGVVKFYLLYLYDYFRFRIKGWGHTASYFNIRYEVEAYANQENKRYVV